MSAGGWQPDPTRDVIRLGIGRAALVPEHGIAGMLVGSCVGLFLYETNLHIVAAAHVSLPSSRLGGATPLSESSLGKFGDLAAGYLLSLIEGAGGSRSRIRVKIAGAARMFGPATNPNGTSRDSIGDQNADAVRNSVEALGFSVAASDCGGSNGRKLFFDTRDGLLRIVTVRGELLEL